MITINLIKAKEIAHEIRCKKRDEAMLPYDKVIAAQIPGIDLENAELTRQQIRDDFAVIQTNIDNCQTCEEIKQIIDSL